MAYDASKPYSVKNLLKFLVEDLGPNASGIQVDTSPKTVRDSGSGFSTTGSYDWMVLGDSISWNPRVLNARLEETGSSNSIYYRVIATNEASPDDPSTSLNDWYDVVPETSLSAGTDVDINQTVNAEQIALGVKDNSGSGTINRELEVSSDTGNVELVTRVEDVESAIGDETSTSQEPDSSVAADLLERINALSDALNSGQADDELRTEEQLSPAYEDNSNAIARVGARALHVSTGNYTTTASYAVINDGSETAQLLLTKNDGSGNLNSATKIIGIVENTGGSETADVALEGRFNDLTTTSPWIRVNEYTALSTGSAVSLSQDDESAAFDEYRLVAKNNSGSTTVKGYIVAKGA